MPTARYLHSASVVDGKIYLIGGVASEPGSALILPVEVYDPTTNSWTQKANIPTGRAVLSTSVVNGRIYAIGGAAAGLTGLSTVEEYDPAADTWTRKANMPTPRAALSTSVVDGKIYALGGASRLTSLVGLSTVEQYDPATDTWTRKANLPTPRFALCSNAVEGQIYAIGGGQQSPAVAVVEAYDPPTDTWRTRTPMPTARRNFATCVMAERIFAMGGWITSSYYPYATVEEYDPLTDRWTRRTDMPAATSCLSTSAVDGRIYAMGGTFRPHPCPALSTVYELSGPSPDLNGDGIVDIKDLLQLIESWGQNDPAVDIGPSPFGDGVVDKEDLEVLMSHWGEEPNLIALWKLDEASGTTATDSVGTNDGALIGQPLWQPAGGKMAGALQFDGVDDYVKTPFVLSPVKGAFSVFAWIKNGAPGQVILSQDKGANWLRAAPATGELQTELDEPGQNAAKNLQSAVVITDGAWHRVGLVWDGANRILYVDDIEVARGTLTGLPSSVNGLYLGAGSTLAPGTFWSGLIDDVRIYDRAVTP